MAKHSGASKVAIQIIVAHEHKLFREGIRRLFLEESDLQVIAEAANGRDALDETLKSCPDVLLLDGLILNPGALVVLSDLSKANIRTKFILLAEESEKWLVNEAVMMGIRALIPKAAGIQTLCKVVRCVASGEYWLNRSLMANLLQHDRNHRTPFDLLTPREVQIVAEVAAGSCNLEIARKMGISQETVKRHLANVFQKVGLSSRLELAVQAINMGMGTPSRKSQSMSA